MLYVLTASDYGDTSPQFVVEGPPREDLGTMVKTWLQEILGPRPQLPAYDRRRRQIPPAVLAAKTAALGAWYLEAARILSGDRQDEFKAWLVSLGYTIRTDYKELCLSYP